MKNKIAILIPTIKKDDTLMKCLTSILDNWKEDWIILIGEQNNIEDYSDEKKIFYHTACAREHDILHQDKIKVVKLPYDCGLSYARNKLVEKAVELGIDYCVISADSIGFTESMQKINDLIMCFKHYDIIGMELHRRLSWEAYLDIKEGFVFNFIDRTPVYTRFDQYTNKSITVYNCDIVRNFFIAKTSVLSSILWDEKAKMGEHADWFWRVKQEGYKVGFTDYCAGKYYITDDREYKNIRNHNLTAGKEYIMNKYGIKKWHEYLHKERLRRPND